MHLRWMTRKILPASTIRNSLRQRQRSYADGMRRQAADAWVLTEAAAKGTGEYHVLIGRAGQPRKAI